MKRTCLFFLLIFLMFFQTSCISSSPYRNDPVKESRFMLNTVIEITLYEKEKDARAVFDDLFDEIKKYENKFSRHVPESEISEANNNAGKPVTVSDETVEIIRSSLLFSDISEGLFDISIGPLIDLWDINGNNPRLPSENEIENALEKVDYNNIKINYENNTLFLSKEGMSLDLGAIAKGYITDRLVEYLSRTNIRSAMLNLGGNLYLHGSKPDGSLWQIGIRDPYGSKGNYIGIIQVKNMSVVTSGIYERYFEIENKRYHHILNPRTGYPEDNNLASVSIICPSSTMADGLSTTAFLLGPDKGMELVESLENTEAIFITKDKKVILSSGIKNGNIPFNATDKTFEVE
ncbi:MAG TPA: FAD:protein FMN transferase [Ruminiclostridium sp.]|nr:FAD:protein FMN transferase [Clostridiaceae bacterium]HAA24567.1 FAD:protein FMN transferase [Ruminiclostridium sp.]